MASAAKAGGTKITETFAEVAFMVFFYSIKYGAIEMIISTFARSYPSYYIRSIFYHLHCMKIA